MYDFISKVGRDAAHCIEVQSRPPESEITREDGTAGDARDAIQLRQIAHVIQAAQRTKTEQRGPETTARQSQSDARGSAIRHGVPDLYPLARSGEERRFVRVGVLRTVRE